MINKDKIKGFVIGVTSAAVIMSSAAFAQNIEKALTAVYNNIRICVNGTEITPVDALGNTVEPFIIDGTTYLPVRAVAEALGENVDWDGDTNTVYIGERAAETGAFTPDAGLLSLFKNETLATAGGTQLKGALYNYVIKSNCAGGVLKNYSENYSETGNLQSMTIGGVPAAKALSDSASSQFEQIYALSAAANADGTAKKSEAKVNDEWSVFRNGFSDNEYAALLEDFSTTDEALRSFIKGMALANIYADKLYEKEYSKEYTDDELYKAYNESYVHVKHILVDSEQAAKDIIAKLRKKADFDELMKNYNTDFGEPEEGYTFTKGDMVKEFEDAAFSLKDGAYTTEPIKSAYGYHIIIRLPIDKDAVLGDSDSIKRNIAGNIYNNTLREIFEKYSISYTAKYNEYTSTIK